MGGQSPACPNARAVAAVRGRWRDRVKERHFRLGSHCKYAASLISVASGILLISC